MKLKNFVLFVIPLFLIISCGDKKQEGDLTEVTINEAVRTLLYLPLYHAQEQGFFEKNGVKVNIVTGGTATNSFAAMLSGEADFSQADPMYVPISNEKGSNTKVVAQVVARIAVWGVTMETTISKITAETLKGKKISTHPRPMTAYTYTVKAIEDAGLTVGKDVEIIQSQPGTELIPLLNGKSDYALTLEPQTSTAVVKGAKVVLSYPEILGDQVFTGLMTRQDYIDENKETVKAVVDAYQQALADLHDHPDKGLMTAKKYFPQVEEKVLELAVNRIITEGVVPRSVNISEESWDKAIQVRVNVGDLKSKTSLRECYYGN